MIATLDELGKEHDVRMYEHAGHSYMNRAGHPMMAALAGPLMHVAYDPDAVKKHLSSPDALAHLAAVRDTCVAAESFTAAVLEPAIRAHESATGMPFFAASRMMSVDCVHSLSGLMAKLAMTETKGFALSSSMPPATIEARSTIL